MLAAKVFLFDFVILAPTLVHNLTSWYLGTLLFSRLSGGTSISNTTPSAWNKASAPMYFKLSIAKLASDWTLWKSVFGQWWGHIYGHSFCQLFYDHGKLLWWAPWKTRTWQQKVSLVILEADPDMAGGLSSCLIPHIKPVLVPAHSWESTDGIRHPGSWTDW